ncbi:glycosyltransferase [Sphingomonas profundi]|uniref:glycosyltransferase n=1 Tax=Alterirhizorhabdus profundi TaxID=2681549 RepID=UPI001E4DBDE3|nr:glycosyltransferase [Sphingomonas profundi]
MQTVLPLSAIPSIVVIGDRVDPAAHGVDGPGEAPWPAFATDAERRDLVVEGGYLERLPLACIKAGLVDHAEIWHHHHGGTGSFHRAGPLLAYRGLPLDAPSPPFASQAMIRHFAAHGAPHILVVLGLGVDEDVLRACGRSVILYNSIDAPALRVPPAVSGLCDIVLTGAQWQSDEVTARHPGKATLILPIGPEFAAPQMFRPLGGPKDYDLIYVAAAQPYKCHDLLFDALERLPRDLRALCLFGYGEMGDALRDRAARQGLPVECIGPPGVPFDEVNRLMNRARFGVVCGRDDGAPAILTEYMLAGLPVLANAELACGSQYILPETGRLAAPQDFAAAIMAMRADHGGFSPREAVLARWTWQHSIARLAPVIAAAAAAKRAEMRGKQSSARELNEISEC